MIRAGVKHECLGSDSRWLRLPNFWCGAGEVAPNWFISSVLMSVPSLSLRSVPFPMSTVSPFCFDKGFAGGIAVVSI